MKRLLLVLTIGCTVSLFAGAATALADAGPHKMGQGLTPSTCAACHRAHTGQAPFLLKEKMEALCFSCHGSTATGSSVDVVDGVGYPEGITGTGRETAGESRTGAIAALRGGGFKYAMIESNTVEKERGVEGSHGIPTNKARISAALEYRLRPSTSAHSINESSQIAWGSGELGAEKTTQYGAEIKLTCGACHDPHGNGNYRILRPTPEGGAVTKGMEAEGTKEAEEGETPIVTKAGVVIKESSTEEGATHEYQTTNYWASWNKQNPEFYYRVSAWCALCHTRLYEKDGSGSATTSSGDAVYNYRHRTNYTLKEYKKTPPTESAFEHCTENGSNCTVGAGGAAGAKPSCIQCHVAHGTDAKMEGIAGEVKFPNGSTEAESKNKVSGEDAEGVLGKAEDSFLLRLNNRGVCQTCHNK